MHDDPFRRHLDDYAAVGRDGAVPPMVHEIYRRGRRHQRLQTTTWGAVGVLTLAATFLAGMVVRDQTEPAAADAAIAPTTTTMPATTSSLPVFDPFASSTTPTTFGTTTLYTTTSYPYTTGSSYTTTSYTTTTSTRPPSTAPFAPTLTSGKHSVILKSISGSSVKFDKVEFFRGEAAEREAAADRRRPTRGWYIRNENPALRTHTATSNVSILATNRTMGKTGEPGALTKVTLAQLDAKIPTSSQTLFRITLSSGRITAITEHDLS